MAGLQDFLALGIVALVVGLFVYRRLRRKRSSSCGDCAAAGPPAKEATVRFYRRVKPNGGKS